jgi:hypothetical protein
MWLYNIFIFKNKIHDSYYSILKYIFHSKVFSHFSSKRYIILSQFADFSKENIKIKHMEKLEPVWAKPKTLEPLGAYFFEFYLLIFLKPPPPPPPPLGPTIF